MIKNKLFSLLFFCGLWCRVGLAAILIGLAPGAWAGLNIERWTTAQGAQVLFVENHALPMLDLQVSFDAGSRRDPAGKEGTAHLAAGMLLSGADGVDEASIHQALADLGAQMDSDFSYDSAGLSLRTLSNAAERDAAVAWFARILARPDYPAPAFQREKARLLAGIRQGESQPAYLADKTLKNKLYPEHPYGYSGWGQPASLAVVTREDVQQFARTHFVASRAVIAMIGDVSREQAELIAQRLSTALPVGQEPLPEMKPLPEFRPSAPIRISHPATQSHILLGMPMLTRSDPDYFPLVVANYILGGGSFDARLTKAIRDRQGYAYAVHSALEPRLQPGPFTISLQTKREQTDAALLLVRMVMEKLRREGPTDKEIIQAKSNIIGSFPLRLDSNAKILDHLVLMGRYGLPSSYLDDYLKAVYAVTQEQIKDVLNRRLDPEGLQVVIVGEAETQAVPSVAEQEAALQLDEDKPVKKAKTPAASKAEADKTTPTLEEVIARKLEEQKAFKHRKKHARHQAEAEDADAAPQSRASRHHRSAKATRHDAKHAAKPAAKTHGAKKANQGTKAGHGKSKKSH